MRQCAVLLSAVAIAVAAGGVHQLVGRAHPDAAAPVASTSAQAGPPRDETLYTSGTSSGPPTNFNPLDARSYTGSQGLLYEPLFLYDPVKATLIPWLATSGTWTAPGTYRLQVRGGVSWVNSSSGSRAGTLSGADVAYSINLAVDNDDDPYHSDVTSVQSVAAAGNTVTVKFRQIAGYAPWQEFLWHSPVLPASVWSQLPGDEQLSAANMSPVSTGPMLLAKTSPTEACYRDNPYWWAKTQLRLSFKFDYLCDVVDASSGAELSDLLAGRIDWSNSLLRGVPSLADAKTGGYGIKTYYPGAPYMIPANTAWLQMDTAKTPMTDVNFRRAVAFAVDPSAIVSGVYTGTVKVADPTGLLPELGSFISASAVRSYGFHYSQSLAKQYLARSGYRGQDLSLEVPEEWVDLVSAAKMISEQLGRVGMHVTAKPVPMGTRNADVTSGDYEMVINTDAGLASTPWDYFDKVYQLPINANQTAGANTERFSGPADWALVQQASATPTTDTAKLKRTYAKLEGDFLQDLPEIPLWYGGAWFQANTTHWEDYPASTIAKDQYTPVMWTGWLGSTTTVYALAALVPKSH